jgi:TRAP-type uncharacterized transport system substrate-binding protein
MQSAFPFPPQIRYLPTMKKIPLNLARISMRDLIVVVIPALLVVVAAFWVAYKFVRPAPPTHLVMSTGAESGAYYQFGKRYQDILARYGVTLELRTSAGGLENYEKLADENTDVDIGFVQGGTATADDAPDLVTLGSVFYEPVWVFYGGDDRLTRLSQLRGKRIAIGGGNSANRKLALELLSANDAAAPPTRLLTHAGVEAAEALASGKIDAMIIVGAPEAGIIKSLLYMQGVRLMSFNHAAAYTRRFEYLYTVTLPQGTIDLVHDIPPADTLLFAPTANIVAKNTLHPALVDLMMQAMTEVHGGRGVFQNAHEFPSPKDHDFPLSSEAQRYYTSGAPFLQRYLPFWAATLIDRIAVLLIPLIAILIPVMKVLPGLYTWRIRSRIFRLYGELKYLELDIKQNFDPSKFGEYQKQLEKIDEAANTRPIPLSFADQQYTLRQHIDFVRMSLEKLRPAQG